MTAPMRHFKAKDMLRAVGLPLLAIHNAAWRCGLAHLPEAHYALCNAHALRELAAVTELAAPAGSGAGRPRSPTRCANSTS